jgi:hypothetical protein
MYQYPAVPSPSIRPRLPADRLGALALLLLVSTGLACARNASVSESQCAAGDWETIGYRDGALGYRSSRLLAHQDACVPHGVTPDRSAYQVGWQQGIAEFCQPDNGFELGRSGEGHANVCPAPQRDAFLAAFDRGRSLYAAGARVREVENAIAQKTLRLRTIDEEMVATASAQLDPMLLPAHRIQLAARVKTLYDEKTRLAAEIPALEEELRLRVRELEALDGAMASTAG